MQDKTIFLASDHAGANLKNHLRDWLKAQGYDIEDLGTDSPDISVAAATTSKPPELSQRVKRAAAKLGQGPMALERQDRSEKSSERSD